MSATSGEPANDTKVSPARAGEARPGRLTALALAALLFSSSSARAEDAGDILRRAEQVRSPDFDYAVDFRLDVSDPDSAWKQRSALYTMIAHGKDDSLVLMREPRSFYPGLLLISNGRYWLLLPKADKPFQLLPRYVLDGDVSNGDLARGNLVAHYRARLEGEEVVRGDPCFVLELIRTSNLGMYARIRYWIARDRYRPRKFEFYGLTGALLKVAYYEDYRKGPLGLRPTRIEVQAPSRPAQGSTLTFSNLRRVDARELPFTREALPGFRDAALETERVHGRQAEAEDLLARLAQPPTVRRQTR